MLPSSQTIELLAEIDEFLERTGMGPTYLGLIGARNGHLVARLRRGGEVHTKTAIELRRFMKSHQAKRRGRRPR